MSDSLWSHGLQHTMPPSPSLSPRACPSSFHWIGDAIQPSHPVSPFTFCSQSFPASGSFPMSWLFTSGGQSIELQLQHQSFQWIFRVDLLQNGLVGSPCSPRDSQESSPTPQCKSINSLVLSLLYGLTLTSIHDYWKNLSFDSTDLCWQSNISAF